MSTEQGVVTKIENGFAWVRAQRKSACGTCANKV
ncbi:MAG: SoxR reducing system RseC family protein, partial [Deltaproteobacteria bacterium]|nr:SoxR reducing system RseC family protein [Deltaproteobacteria bacterium]